MDHYNKEEKERLLIAMLSRQEFPEEKVALFKKAQADDYIRELLCKE